MTSTSSAYPSLNSKYKTILCVNLIFAVGNTMLFLSAIPPLHLPTELLFFVGVFLIAFGAAGVKPCIAPFGGEQFVLPEQCTKVTKFFSIFFFVHTSGAMISITIAPILRKNVQCFGQETCYPLAYGVTTVTMTLATAIFLSGKPFYKVHKPTGSNMLVTVTKCITHAVSNKISKKFVPTSYSHWLDFASDSYAPEIIKDIKGLLRILPKFLPVQVFFSLYEQIGSRWTLQTTRMNGNLGWFSIKADQMQVSNSILMLVFLPIFNWFVYPVISRWEIRIGSLEKMVVGGFLASISFAVAGILELQIQSSYLSILWQLPQYILMACGDVLYIPSGMELAYTEAPASMKSVTQAIWHMMCACGNLIVIFTAKYFTPESQSTAFFIFSVAMFATSIIYGRMTSQYKYVSEGDESNCK